MMNQQQIKSFVQQNWRDESTLATLIGQQTDYPKSSITWNWGSIPTEKAQISFANGKIAGVKTWSGLNWSARGGYGSPFCSVAKPTEEEDFEYHGSGQSCDIDKEMEELWG